MLACACKLFINHDSYLLIILHFGNVLIHVLTTILIKPILLSSPLSNLSLEEGEKENMGRGSLLLNRGTEGSPQMRSIYLCLPVKALKLPI